jgi:hypothetical protein
LGTVAVDDTIFKAYIDEASCARTLKNIAENQKVSIVMVDLMTAESYQFKGKCVGIEKFKAEDQDHFDAYMQQFDAVATKLGFPKRGIYNYPHSAMISLIVEVHEVYEQTPKKGTGQRLF